MTDHNASETGKRKPRAAKAVGAVPPDAVAPPPPPAAPPSPPAQTGRGLKIALAVSLALNLLILGVVGGAVIKSRGPDGPMMARDLAFGPFTEALTREQRRDLLRGMGMTREGGGRAMREEVRRDFDAVLAALRAQPFDPASFAAVIAQQNERLTVRVAQGRTALVALVSVMTPEERQRYADALEREAPGGRRGGQEDRP